MIEDIRNIRIADFDYPLPDERIAKHPLAERDRCRLLTYRNGAMADTRFAELPQLLPSDALLVCNDTRVINARLRFRKGEGGALIEVFCLEPASPRDYALVFQTTERCSWTCLVGNAKRWKDAPLSMSISIDGREVTLTAQKAGRQGNAFVIDFEWTGGVTFATILDAVGEIPIPPYLNRGTEQSDSIDYQTVYGHIEGSVAAPTAGLHFSEAVLKALADKGIERAELTLHVGAGTFQPVKSEAIGGHAMHTESIAVTRTVLQQLLRARGPIVAVGTTSVRTLESLYYIGAMLKANPEASPEQLVVPQWMPYEQNVEMPASEALNAIIAWMDSHGTDTYVGSTQIMIVPSFRFRIVDAMVTNFHQPQSTLLLLVSAFIGDDWRKLYRHALDSGYRFLSYGDAQLLWRNNDATPIQL